MRAYILMFSSTVGTAEFRTNLTVLREPCKMFSAGGIFSDPMFTHHMKGATYPVGTAKLMDRELSLRPDVVTMLKLPERVVSRLCKHFPKPDIKVTSANPETAFHAIWGSIGEDRNENHAKLLSGLITSEGSCGSLTGALRRFFDTPPEGTPTTFSEQTLPAQPERKPLVLATNGKLEGILGEPGAREVEA